MGGNVKIFIDSNNIYKEACKLLGERKIKLSWVDFINGVFNEYRNRDADAQLRQAYYYSALSDRTDNPTKYDNQKRFLDALAKVSFIEVKIGYLLKVPTNPSVPIDIADTSTYRHIEKDTDTKFSNDIMENFYKEQCDIFIIMAADGDHFDTIERVVKEGKKVILAVPVGMPCQKLKSVIGEENVIYLTKDMIASHLVKEFASKG
jgi:uncharacterized LabA/DUF88 family protein